jgi:hypothetical protein
VFVPFASGKPNGDPIDVLTGFLATTAMPGAGRSASPSTAPARSSLPMTSAMPYGG